MSPEGDQSKGSQPDRDIRVKLSVQNMWHFKLAKHSHEEFARLGQGKEVSWIEHDKLLIGVQKTGSVCTRWRAVFICRVESGVSNDSGLACATCKVGKDKIGRCRYGNSCRYIHPPRPSQKDSRKSLYSLINVYGEYYE